MEPYSFFFSGTEPNLHFDTARALTNNMLMSYQHMKRKGKTFVANRIKTCPTIRFMMDSGAHTFLRDEEVYAEKLEKDPDYFDNYIHEYIQFLQRNKDNIFAAVELDIASLVGKEVVEKWRKDYFAPLEEEGIKVIYVWHGSDGMEEWERMCQRFEYIGFSYHEDTNFTDAMLNKMFMIARKYKTKVHGFAVAGMELLTKYPFYTSDASTWCNAYKHGEISLFEGRKIKRLRKDKWKTVYRNRLIGLGGNWNLLEREDNYEMLRMSAIAYKSMETFINQAMKSKHYWNERGATVVKKILKKKEKPQDIREEIEEEVDKKLPELVWFDGEMEDWEEYAEALGIDTELPKEEACDFIRVFFDMITRYELDAYETEDLYAFCDKFGIDKKDSNTRNKALKELNKAFTQHMMGERHEFGNLSQVEEIAAKMPKDRDGYPREPDYVMIDVDESECKSFLAGFLPEKGMPEVEAYDAELRNIGVEVVRDNKGRFIKGQKKVRKPKSLVSDSLATYSCDTCIKGATCPHYTPGYACILRDEFKKFDVRDMDSIKDAMASLLEFQLQRTQMAAFQERMDSGIPSQDVTEMMNLSMKYANFIMEMGANQVVASQRTVMRDNGQIETHTEVRGNPQQGGILAKLFAPQPQSQAGKSDDNIETIDVTPIDTPHG